MVGGLAHLGWNLFLAGLAVLLGRLLALTARVQRARGDALFALPLALIAISWLLVLPNTAYLFTEVRHFFDALEQHDLWSQAHVSRAARWALARRGAVLAIYGAAGALSFGLAIRPVRDVAREAGLRLAPLVPPFFALVALGVYLGLVQRLNSWDVLSGPGRVATLALMAVSSPGRILRVVLGAGALYAVYEIVDVWLDGATLRLARTRGVARH